MADVTLNSAVRANLRTLNSTAELMQQTSKRLSTGKEVNSALDNPSNFFTAQSLERRAGDLGSLLDSVGNSVKTLEAADNGLSSISNVVESLKATARSALQSTAAVTEKSSSTTTATGANGVATADDLTSTTDGSSANALQGGTIIYTNERTGATATITISSAGINTLEKLNEELGKGGLSARLEAGQLVLETSNAYASQSIVATGTTASNEEIVLTGTLVSGATIDSTPTIGGDGNTKRNNFKDDYNDLLKQIDALAKDASYNGVNLLNGDDLEVIFNEDGSSKLDVKGVGFSSEGLGLSSIADLDFRDSNKVNAVLAKLEEALTTIESQSSKFGSQLQIVETREKFTKSMIGTLEDGAYGLTAADTNTEAANLASLQTRQSMIVSALSISNQQEQGILQLLR